MSGKIWLRSGDAPQRRVFEPFAGADHALIVGACPGCGHVEQAPEGHGAQGDVFKGAGTGRRITPDDRSYEADAVALWAIAARISEFGFSPNRVAALGENVILLVNLAWSAVLYLRFLRGCGSFTSLEKWQTDYLPVYGAWAAMVAILFPPLFRYL